MGDGGTTLKSAKRAKGNKHTANRSVEPSRHGLVLYRGRVIALIILSGIGGWGAISLVEPGEGAKDVSPEVTRGHAPYETVDDLMRMRDEELAKLDVARMNLIVAKGLPDFRDLDIEKYLRQLDEWAETVRFDTDRHRYRFEQNPAEFNDSWADYCVAWLCSDINTVFNVDYDLEFDSSDASNLFLNGIVDRRRGTCVSMPVLHVALGQRLGYPIRLVCVPTHLFARWDGGTERINIEATGYGASHPDSEYEEKFLVSPECKRRGGEMASLTPRQTLAAFLLSRADCRLQAGDMEEALLDEMRAYLLHPENPVACVMVADTVRECMNTETYFAHSARHIWQAFAKIQPPWAKIPGPRLGTPASWPIPLPPSRTNPARMPITPRPPIPEGAKHAVNRPLHR